MPSPAARALAVALTLVTLAFPGCRRQSPAAPSAPAAPPPVSVVVSIPPLVGLVKPLLTEGGNVRALIPPGRSEHGFEFTNSDLANLARADIIVYVGMGLEPGLETFLSTHPDEHRRIVRFATSVGDTTQQQADHDAHGHSGPDPHLWLDPSLCPAFVTEVNAAIQAVYRDRKILTPEARRRSDQALTDLIGRLQELDGYARGTLAPFKGQALVTHHDAWRRLAERCGLEIAAVIRPVETGEPTAGAIASAVDAIRQRHVAAIFVEPQFNRDAADRIAKATGVKVATLDPLGDGDYFAMMRANIDSIAAALAPARPAP